MIEVVLTISSQNKLSKQLALLKRRTKTSRTSEQHFKKFCTDIKIKIMVALFFKPQFKIKVLPHVK
jgi:hypothetical protein